MRKTKEICGKLESEEAEQKISESEQQGGEEVEEEGKGRLHRKDQQHVIRVKSHS